MLYEALFGEKQKHKSWSWQSMWTPDLHKTINMTLLTRQSHSCRCHALYISLVKNWSKHRKKTFHVDRTPQEVVLLAKVIFFALRPRTWWSGEGSRGNWRRVVILKRAICFISSFHRQKRKKRLSQNLRWKRKQDFTLFFTVARLSFDVSCLWKEDDTKTTSRAAKHVKLKIISHCYLLLHVIHFCMKIS